MPFLNKLQHEWVELDDPEYDKGEDWRLTKPLSYHWIRRGIIITAPKGFVYDQASVPTFILPFIVNDTGRISKPSVPHDLLYKLYRELRYKTSCHQLMTSGHRWTKSEVDLLFRDAMLDNGVPKMRAYIAWLAVKGNLIARLKWMKP